MDTTNSGTEDTVQDNVLFRVADIPFTSNMVIGGLIGLVLKSILE
jgi:hypothetical protein